jgi:chromate transporter
MTETQPTVTRLELARYFLRLGAMGFAGPIALVGYMHRDLVETRRWIREDEYREGIALAQLSPGPLAAQLCFYSGYIRGGLVGATLSGLGFVLPLSDRARPRLGLRALRRAHLDASGLLRGGSRGHRADHPKRLQPDA